VESLGFFQQLGVVPNTADLVGNLLNSRHLASSGEQPAEIRQLSLFANRLREHESSDACCFNFTPRECSGVGLLRFGGPRQLDLEIVGPLGGSPCRSPSLPPRV